MFDRDEIQALVLGARIVAQFGDPALARASESILSKVAAVAAEGSRAAARRNAVVRAEAVGSGARRRPASPSRARRWSRSGGCG